MSLKVNGLVTAASVISLVCGLTGMAQADTRGHPDTVRLARIASLHRDIPVPATQASADVRPRDTGVCIWISADGVRIRSTPSTSGAVLGLAYYLDKFRMATDSWSDWVEGTDLRTGVHGWVSVQFVSLSFFDCVTGEGSTPTRPAGVVGR